MITSDIERVGVIIRFADDPTPEDARDLLAAGFAPGFVRYHVVPSIFAEGPMSAVRKMSANPRVRYIELNSKIPYALDRATVVGRARGLWDASYKSLDQVHSDGIDGKGIGIAIVDSGIDGTHPDLIWKPMAEAQGTTPKTILNVKLVGRDSVGLSESFGLDSFVEANAQALDVPDTDTTGGHGTHVAGIASGNGSASNGRFAGVAPGASLIGLGAGETLVVTLGLAAFDWIHLHHRDYNIRVVNNSWGGAGDWDPESSITKAVQKLVNEDKIVVVFAAGNSGGNGSDIQTSVWGNIPEVIQVANYYDRKGWLDATSSRGSKSMPSTWPDVAAPGTEVISTAATGKPVTYIGNYQDAAINELEGYGEPDVITAPVPQPVEANVAGKDVIVGNYASFTGTSMASPFIAGVVALILQANPSLEPEQVKEILRATADMPPGRTYSNDGFAVGTGVVDAAEAVAVALKMKDGANLTGGLRTAYVDSSSVPWHINEQLPRMVDIDSPNPNSDIAGKVHVTGRFLSGGLTDNSVPLMPPPPPILSGDPHIYQGGVIDPLGPLGTYAVAPGEPVGLSVRSITSNDATLKLNEETFKVRYRIIRRGYYVVHPESDGADVLFGPADAVVSADGSALRSDLDWDVPVDAQPGDYVFEATEHVTWNDYPLANLAFTIGVPVLGSGSGTRPTIPVNAGTPFTENSTVFFSNDFETNADGWTVEQNGTGPGLLTSWSLIDADTSMLTWNGAHSGSKTFYVGDSLVPDQFNGLYYEDLSNVSLVSPVIDLSKAQSAELTYWRSGMSERDFDLLRVFIAPEGSQTWTKVDETSGDLLNGGGALSWEPSTIDLNAYVRQPVRLKFEFTSDETSFPPNLVGWYIDDVAVSGASGTGPLILPSLDLDLDQGIGSLKTSISYSALSSSPIKHYELDFGDGTVVLNQGPGTVVHTYPGGQWTTTLTVLTDDGSRSVSHPVDVARLGEIEVRVGTGPWVDGGPALSADRSFAVDLDLASLQAGGVQLQARHCEGVGACIFDSIPVRIASAPPVVAPSVRPVAKPRRSPVAAPAVQNEVPSEVSPSAAPTQTQPSPTVTAAADASANPVANVKGWSASLRATSLLLVALVAASLGFVLGRRRRRPS